MIQPSSAQPGVRRRVSRTGAVGMPEDGAAKPTDRAPMAMSAEPRNPLMANSATSDDDDSVGRPSLRGVASAAGTLTRSAAATRSMITMGF